MSNEIKISMPQTLNHPYFFSNIEEVIIDATLYQQWNSKSASEFSYELLASQKVQCYHPWEHVKEVFADVVNDWKDIQAQLDELYQQRKTGQVGPLMKQGISICFASLFWLNEKPIILHEWQKAIDELPFVPVNFAERMEFVLARPNLYQSFKVLEQFMVEVEKLFVRSQILKKKK